MLHWAAVHYGEPGAAPERNAGKLILVTGGSGIIGASIVSSLVQAGYPVCAAWSKDEGRATALRSKTGCELRQVDIGDEAQVEALFASLPAVWAVVHAAGVSHNAMLLRQSAQSWQETLRVNATGSFLVTRAALQFLPDGGRLVLIASRVGQSGNAGQGAYAASKAATIALAKVAAREGGACQGSACQGSACQGGARCIAVNALCPGLVPSPLTASLSEASLRVFRERSVLGQLGRAEDVAGAVGWLLSDEAANVSGQVLHCDSRI